MVYPPLGTICKKADINFTENSDNAALYLRKLDADQKYHNAGEMSASPKDMLKNIIDKRNKWAQTYLRPECRGQDGKYCDSGCNNHNGWTYNAKNIVNKYNQFNGDMQSKVKQYLSDSYPELSDIKKNEIVRDIAEKNINLLDPPWTRSRRMGRW